MYEMKVTGVDHIGIAVKSIDEALKLWEEVLGIKCTGREEVEEQKVVTAFLPLGDTEVELLEPTSPESPVSKFIEKRGEGIHHLALRVENIEAALEELKGKGIRLIDEEPRCGAGAQRLPSFTQKLPAAFCLNYQSGKMDCVRRT